ncbi:MAG: leucine-rich repeat protein, partial [Anaeroplasmataceae bacterium]|nr:leucine-rich repeat protein [Anaeroplasmataceae bacterium]
KGTIFEDFYQTTGIKNPIVNLSNDEAFTYMIVNGEVYITGLNGVAPDTLVIPSYIDDLPVTKICEGAFEGCSSSIKLNVLYLKVIEENAFKGCINLTEVYLTRLNTIGAYAFRNCSNLKNVTIESIIEIGTYAFNGCTNLKQITLPNCISSIGEKALGFTAQTLISNFVMSGDAGTLAQTYAIENGIEFKALKEDIKSFYYNTYFNEKTGNEEIVITLVDTQTTGNIVIPESYNGMTISAIGDEAFSECFVTGVTLPATITEIGEKSFENCHFLESINLENILTIGKNAFYGCQSLKYVNMPLVTEIPWAAFSNCSSLKVAELNGVIELGQDAFNSCYELEKVICPNLETLDAAFNTTTSLKSVDTKNVVTITGNAFIYSKSIEELYFPNLESITAERPFSSCPSLKKVVIGKKFKSYVVDSALDLASWTYYNVPIYSYSGSKAEEWALKCLDETRTKHWDFVAIDDIDTLAITKNLSSKVEAEMNSDLALTIQAEGIGLTYQWFTTTGTIASGMPIEGAIGSKLRIDTTSASNTKYFVKIIDWMDKTVTSQICEVTIEESEPVHINVKIDEHITSLQNGNNTVSNGSTFKINFTVETGYHISQIIVDGEDLSDEEISSSLLAGYEFTNVLENHTIEILSAPNEDTSYIVYHYKHSLKETSYEINGKYYDIEIEMLTGITGTMTSVVAREYTGFTADPFLQREISGNGDTFIRIIYNRNAYTVTLVDCDGATLEGSGTYFYGEKVIAKATLAKGYEWDRWESSNPSVCPNSNNKEYTFTMPTENLTLTAYTNEIPYTPLNIVVTTQEHITSNQNGSNQVDQGESFKVTFTTEAGYHVSQILVDEVPLTDEELSTALLMGYEFTNVEENHTIEILSAPNEDTSYSVYHYKESLVETSYFINGKYYEKEEEFFTGTTGTTTTAEGLSLEGFTMEAFEQDSISGSGDTIISIFYNRNIYSVTLIGCEGVTVEGEGNYLYGQSVFVKAIIDNGYEWEEWESSNITLCPNNEQAEFTFLMPASNLTLISKARKQTEIIEPEDIYINVITDEHI